MTRRKQSEWRKALVKYKRTGRKQDIENQIKEAARRNKGRKPRDAYWGFVKLIEKIDRKKSIEYFKKHYQNFNISDAGSRNRIRRTGKHYFWGIFTEHGKPTAEFRTEARKLGNKFDDYFKAKKPVLCQELLSSCKLISGLEYGILLRAAKILRWTQTEKAFQNAIPEIKTAILLVENKLIELLINGTTYNGRDASYLDFKSNILNTAEALQRKLVAK